jgi:hypothetical protein
MPPLLSDMINGIIGSCQDMRVVVGPPIEDAMLPAAIAMRADVIIIGEAAASTENCARALYRRPTLKILAISWDGRRGSLHELRPHVAAIEEISAESLIAAIRGRTSPAGGPEMPRQ